MNKKTALLLCLVMLVVCLFGAVACDLVETEHVYTEHAAKAATCTTDGNELYYTCNGCNKIFDKEKKEISAVPVIKAGHDFEEHVAVSATCMADGNELYFTCKNCDKIFDKDKNEISAIPVVNKGEHKYVEHVRVDATCTESGNELYYTCDGCSGLFDKDKQPIDEIPTISAKNHAYHEVPAVDAGCESDGNDLYYTCDNGCGKLFDENQNEISAVPVISPNGHDYEEHAAVAATCTTNGNELYYTCNNCDKIFDSNEAAIDAIPGIGATGHNLAWVKSSDGKTAELKCENDGCAENKGTINLTVNDDDRLVVDFDEQNATISLALFGEGLTATSVKYLQKVAVVTTDGTNATFAVADLFDYAVGKVAVQLTVAKDGMEIEVEMLLTVAKLVNNIDDLLALRPVLSHGNASVTGGKVEEADGHKVVTSYYYLLTTDLDGTTRTGITTYGEDIVDEGDTSGNAKSGFVGIFDGGNHTISNYEMNVRGFFGHVGCGTIANVTFANIVFSSTQSTVLGKLMNATVSDVIIKNIEIDSPISDVSGILAYHEIFGSALDKVTIDVADLSDKVNVLARQLTDGKDDWKANSFVEVKIKADYYSGMKLTSTKALTDAIDGVTVEFSPFQVEKPVESTETHYYTGSELTYDVVPSDLYTVSNNKQTQIGTYTVTVSLKPYKGLTWADGTTDDVTFTFEIVELTDEAAEQLASAFAAKVNTFGTPVFPKDKDAVTALMEEYNVLHEDVKAKLTEVKTTLDGYAEKANAYTRLTVTFDTVKLITALSGYDTYYLVIYNPTDAAVPFFYGGNVPGEGWIQTSSIEIAAQSYTQVIFDKKFAEAGNMYLYNNGTPINFADTESGWICKVYGKVSQPGAEVVALPIMNGSVSTDYGKAWKGSGGFSGAAFNLWCGTLSGEDVAKLAEYENVYCYVYNPNSEDVAFFFQDDPNWKNSDITTLKAQDWTKVTLNELLKLSNVNTVYLNVTVPNADSFTQDGWMITDFFGTAK